jgi:hypothetical protein
MDEERVERSEKRVGYMSALTRFSVPRTHGSLSGANAGLSQPFFGLKRSP